MTDLSEVNVAPVVPAPVLLVVAAVLVVLRAVALRGAGTRGQRRRWTAATVALGLLVVAAARPVLGAPDARADTAAPTDVLLLVDRSAATADPGPDGRPRFDGIRDDAAAVVARHPGARIAVISFSARPSLDWPLSDDVWSLAAELPALAPYPDDDPAQVDVAAAATVLRYQLLSSTSRARGARTLVYYLGVGAPGATAPQGSFDPPAGVIDGGAVLDHGASSDDDGAALRRVAAQLGVPYVRRDGPGEESALGPETPEEGSTTRDTGAGTTVSRAVVTELYWLPALLAVLLLGAESVWSVRDRRRDRATAHRDPAAIGDPT